MPLNQELYDRLRKSFSEVKISHEGEAYRSRVVRNVVKNCDVLVMDNAGETYKVCCPYCTDTRFRCNINHMYGQYSPLGYPLYNLVYCYNDGCPLQLRDPATIFDFRMMMQQVNPVDLSKSRIAKGKQVDVDSIRMNWPGEMTRIDELPTNHVAVRYLEQDRKFDVKRLGRFYNVHWCGYSTKPLCRDRIVVPIYHNRNMVGWQARCPFDLPDWKVVTYPKYFTAPGTPKNKILYNMGQAVKFKFLVICEGVTDVWRVGPRSVCTLGAGVLREEQLNQIITHFRDYSGVLLYDGDLKAKVTSDLWERLNAMGVPAALSKSLLDSLQPELSSAQAWSMTRPELLQHIQQTCQQKSVMIDWGLR